DRRSLEIHRFSLTLGELHRLAVLLEWLQRVRIAVIDLSSGRKCIEVIIAGSDPQNLACPVGLRPAFAVERGLPLFWRVRRGKDKSIRNGVALVILHH